MIHRLLLIALAITAMIFAIGPASRADDSGNTTLYSFEDGTDGWWTYANAATITLSSDKSTGVGGSSASLKASYLWDPGESSYMGMGVQPKWTAAGDSWTDYSKGHFAVSFKSDIPVSVVIQLRASDKNQYAFTLQGVSSAWKSYAIPFDMFIANGKSIDLTSVTVDQIVVAPNKVDENPHTLWMDNVLISKDAAKVLPLSKTLTGSGQSGPRHPEHAFRPTGHPLLYTGINLSGGEFGHGLLSVYGKDYTYPTTGEIDYFAERGVNVIRLPFRWEVLQPDLTQPLVAAEVDRYKAVVEEATTRGLTVLIDPHDYDRYNGDLIGSGNVSDKAFAAFWGRLSTEFKDNSKVWFGLMNEPNGVPADQWLQTAQGAVTAIRAAGAKNLILVPGVNWTGAHSWLSDGSTAMATIHDPANHYIFEVHDYLDIDSSGTHPDAISPTIGVERLQDFTKWCRQNKQRAFLGEFGVGAGTKNQTAIDNMISFMEANPDVWVGFTYWAAGPWWGNYFYSVEPRQDGSDREQMAYLTPHFHGLAAKR